MVSRFIWINGVGMVDVLKASTIPVVSPGTVQLMSDVESATVGSPITREDMWAFIGARGGSYSNFTNTSVVQTDGRGGATSKVIDQFYPSNGQSNYAMPPTGTGISLTSVVPIAGGSVEEATLEFDYRMKCASGVPWGWGGKIPGLGGKRPSTSSIPTGGSPSPNGWSARLMYRRDGTEAAASLRANLVGYFYSPNLPAGAIGNDLSTGKYLQANTWHRLRQYHKMNTVTTEGSTTPPADGIHRIWLDDVLCYESTTTVYRFYTDAMITHLVWDNFYGGSDAADGKPWGPLVDTHQQFDNLKITTY